MPAGIIAWVRQQFFDNNGAPLASGTLEFYDSGTTTARAVFSDADLNVSAGTTVTLNSAGFPTVAGSEIAIFLSPVAYRVVVLNSAGTTLRTVDGVYALQTASSVNLDISDAVAGEALSAGDLCYLSDGAGSRTDGRWYRADADTYAYSLHTQLGFAPSAITSGATGTIRTGGVITGLSGLTAGDTYYVSGTAGQITATAPANARPVGQAISATTLRIDFSPPWADPMALVCEGRLTLTSGTPVTTADVTAAMTIYFAPYKGNRIALYDGNRWKLYTFSELSIAVPASTATIYDVYVYDNAGTLTLELTAWTNDTTRATALTTQNGVYVRTGATTRRYVGSFRTTGVSGQTEDSLAIRYVWNYYNRVRRALRRVEATASWTYTTDSWRQANAAGANQLDVVVGVAEVPIQVLVTATLSHGTGGTRAVVGIGEDSTTAMATDSASGSLQTQTANRTTPPAIYYGFPAVGRHTYVWLERAEASGTVTWVGVTADNFQSGIYGVIEG